MGATEEIWIAACAYALQRHWRMVDPEQLEEVSGDLLRDERLRGMTPGQAAMLWLEPVACHAGQQ